MTETINPQESGPRPENVPWIKSYQKAKEAEPSWAKHGMPDLFFEFLDHVQKAHLSGIHLDIGCGNGIKTAIFAAHGLKTLGIDQLGAGFEQAKLFAEELEVQKTCSFLRADATDIPLPNQSVSSISDILMVTHLVPELWDQYLQELNRVLQDGGYILLVLFSDKDQHFHGHPVSPQYTFRLALVNKDLEPNLASFAHYEGMFNRHFSAQDITRQWPGFELVKMVEVVHPVYPSYRKLWNVILQKP